MPNWNTGHEPEFQKIVLCVEFSDKYIGSILWSQNTFYRVFGVEKRDFEGPETL